MTAETERAYIAVSIGDYKYSVGQEAYSTLPNWDNDEPVATKDTVKEIGVAPSGLPGYYLVVITFDKGAQRLFYAAPASIVLELGPERPKIIEVTKPQLVVPSQEGLAALDVR